MRYRLSVSAILAFKFEWVTWTNRHRCHTQPTPSALTTDEAISLGLILPLRLLKSDPNPLRVRAMHLTAFALMIGVLISLAPIPATAANEYLDQVRSLIKAGNFDSALDEVNRFLSTDPKHAQGRFLKGIILTEKNQTDAAIKVFARLATEYPDLPEPHNNLAVLYASRGEYVKARDSLLLAINTHPSYATAHENLGDIYAKMAGLAYDKALQLDLENESAKAKLALMHELVSIDDSSPVAATPVTVVKTTQVSDAQPVSNDEEEVALRTVRDWAAAWSDKDVDKYLSFYASSFAPADGTSRSQWASVRSKRLKKLQFIRIQVDDAAVSSQGGDRLRVTFFQSYQSDTYGDRVRKALLMDREGTQ